MATSQARGRQARTQQTRERITAAVRELLAEGAFHESSVEQVADRAGLSRATLYQHFRSRTELVDAICDTFDVNPALQALRETVVLPDADAALAQTIAHSVAFWSSEDAVLAQLYGAVALDETARELVARQREDRRGELRRLQRTLAAAGRLRPGLDARDVLARLMVLTSYETYRELRLAGLSVPNVKAALQQMAAALLLVPGPSAQ
ncbi:MAG: TetR/AcrR family transcriptional regulator [Solirubrobacteraceae bacterium]